MAFCDLHTHSVFSDGTYTPTEIISEARERGLSAVALTDHNTVAGLPEFLSAAKGTGVEPVAGIEISTDYGEVELHIVGLFIRPEHFSAVDSLLVRLRKNKEASNRKMIDALRAGGYDISFDEAKASSSGLFNRAHIASILVEKGYFGSIAEVFETVLSKESKYYVPAERLPVFEVIEFLESIGAVSVLAHPFLNLSESELRVFLDEARLHGLSAMETVYSTYDGETTTLAKAIADEYRLLESGGSDFHGGRKPDISLGIGRGNLSVPTKIFERLKAKIADFDN